MRCSCCNRNLSDYESTLRHAEHGHFVDTCLACLKDLGIPINPRKDLDPSSEEDEVDEDVNEDWEPPF
jgi:hypothetical protein